MMKYGHCILLLLLISLLCACHPRRSAEEGERFLQKEENYNSRNKYPADTFLISRYSNLLEAEQLYNFTPTQQLRLKLLQLYLFNGYNIPQATRIADKVDDLALRIGNDTLLCTARIQIFLLAQGNGDTTRMLHVIRQQEQLPPSLHHLKDMGFYYMGMAVYYQKQGEWQQALYWLKKARPHVKSVYAWYLQMCQSLLKAEAYSEAQLYTDSIRIVFPEKVTKSNTPYFDFHGQVLIHTNRKKEALDWYAKATEQIETVHKQKGSATYSKQQIQTIYHAALLHHQQGQTDWAIRHLEKLQPHKYPILYTSKNNLYNDTLLLPNCLHLLSECYEATGQLQAATRCLQTLDSIQHTEIKRGSISFINYKHELRRNTMLSSNLVELEKAAVHTRQIQYLLYAIISCLLIVIIAGLLAWRRHQRRLRQLYEVLMEQHTIWLQAHETEDILSPGILPLPVEPTSEKSKEPEAPEIPVIDVRQPSQLFLRILHLMDTRKPYRDPSFDLVTLAQLAATNRSQLSSLINRETPNGFSYWLAEYRVNDLIQQTELFPDKSMDELYVLSGFPSRTTFFRQFRLVTGLTPRQYKTQQNRPCSIKSE